MSAYPTDKYISDLRAWAAVLDIPSGRFVNDDLLAAAEKMEGLRDQLARTETELATRDETIRTMGSELRAVMRERDEALREIEEHHPREMSGINKDFSDEHKLRLAAEARLSDTERRLKEAVEALSLATLVLEHEYENRGSEDATYLFPIGPVLDRIAAIVTAEKERERG